MTLFLVKKKRITKKYIFYSFLEDLVETWEKLFPVFKKEKLCGN